MTKNDKISLNFLPIKSLEFSFTVYKKKWQFTDKRPSKNVRYYSLPEDNESENWSKYWIAFEPLKSFNEFNCPSTLNPYITIEYLYRQAFNFISTNHPDLILDINEKFNSRRIHLIFEKHSLGTQSVWVEPYYLKANQEFGFLTDFHFHSNKIGPLSKEELRLSYSLNQYYRANNDYHQNKYDAISKVISSVLQKIFIRAQEQNLTISTKFRKVHSDFLQVKEYNFGNNSCGNSQFNGLKNNPPFQELQKEVHFFYIFKDDHIDLARDLVFALQGKSYQYTFPGTEQMFSFKMHKENQSRIPIKDFSENEIKRTSEEIISKKKAVAFAIFLFPETESDFYYRLKNKLLSNHILSQAIHVETIRNKSGLKWSISSIGLQIFSKAGGIPWRVTPSHQECLIIGIGKSHKRNDNGQIEKFYAYSVLIDSSGEYLEMNTLANDVNEDNYLKSLGNNLKNVIENKSSDYRHIVLHVPYKVQQTELNRFLGIIKECDDSLTFSVIKINDNSKYFGYNEETNSLIPYESTFIKLSRSEYLIWTEGLNYNSKKVNKRYANPLHIEFCYPDIEDLEEEQNNMYLQDILNLSGASWRGFNAKSMPISIFYPKRISKFIAEFQTRNLPEVEFENLPPWFL
jgi:hypothetical protein